MSWIQRTMKRVARAFLRIFRPVMVSKDGGEIMLVETVSQVVTRKVVAVALGSLALSLTANPSAFTVDESIAMKVGDWLAQVASTLWNYNGVATF